MWVALGFTLAQAQDNGVPDTLYLEVYPGDDGLYGFPADVRLNLRVSNDIPDPDIDSIAGIVVPLSFTSTNPWANAQIQPAKNNTDLYPFPDLNNSIFRHMPDMNTATERNWMMDYAEQGIGLDWDTLLALHRSHRHGRSEVSGREPASHGDHHIHHSRHYQDMYRQLLLAAHRASGFLQVGRDHLLSPDLG